MRDRHLIRRRIFIWKYGRPVVLLLVLVFVSLLDRAGYLFAAPSESTLYDARIAHVLRVIDGDTIEVDIPDQHNKTLTTRVRLWGIDCPEMNTPPLVQRRSQNSRSITTAQPPEPYAIEASDLARELAEGRMVRLRLERHRTRGPFGRVVAHVDILPSDSDPNGPEINLAEQLLRAGLAENDPSWPHSLMTYFQQLERSARRRQLGFWKPDASMDG